MKGYLNEVKKVYLLYFYFSCTLIMFSTSDFKEEFLKAVVERSLILFLNVYILKL